MPFKGLFGKGKDAGGEIDIEDYLNELSIRDGKIVEQDDVTYVKPVMLDSEGKGIGTVIDELEKNNPALIKKTEHVFLTKTDAVSPKELKEKLAALKKIKIKATPISILDAGSLNEVKKMLNKIASEA